jgi:hypothetical protein
MTSTLTPRKRQQVHERDGKRCGVPGCRSSWNLDIHHLIWQEDGGGHQLWNLTLICGGHHRAIHNKTLRLWGRAPHAIECEWARLPSIAEQLNAEADRDSTDETDRTRRLASTTPDPGIASAAPVGARASLIDGLPAGGIGPTRVPTEESCSTDKPHGSLATARARCTPHRPHGRDATTGSRPTWDATERRLTAEIDADANKSERPFTAEIDTNASKPDPACGSRSSPS